MHDAVVGRTSRVTVLVAFGTHAAMPETALAKHLGYLDPHEVDIDVWAEDPGTLVVRAAGELLFRLR